MDPTQKGFLVLAVLAGVYFLIIKPAQDAAALAAAGGGGGGAAVVPVVDATTGVVTPAVMPVAPVVVTPSGPKYLGCYKDTGSRTLPKHAGNMTLSECAAKAKAAGNSVFGMQYNNGVGGDKAECWIGANSGYDKYGAASNCGAKKLGGSWANAVYSV